MSAALIAQLAISAVALVVLVAVLVVYVRAGAPWDADR